MKLTQISVCVALALTCTSCALTPKEANTSSIKFNYKIENASPNGVVQVFDMNGSTLVQIKNIRLRMPIFLDEFNNEIAHEIIGETAKLVGIHKRFSIVANGMTSNVIRNKYEDSNVIGLPKEQSKASAIPDKYKNASEEELRLEVERMKKELIDLREFISQGSSDSGQAKSTQLMRSTNNLIVEFQNNSDVFVPNQEIKLALIKLAKESSGISVKAYTDSTVVNSITTALAKSRALSAKNWLIANGSSPKKITLAYEAAGHFIADNKTKEGKAKNRRVEIQAS
jgi:outer membrane protein OmpA-like peptidoglycan-associated protein